MDTDTREEFFERFTKKQTYEVNDESGHYDAYYADWVGTPIEVIDFIEQKLKRARIEELDRAYEAGDVCRCDGERILAVPFSYFSERLAELKGETKTDWKTISELSRKLKPLEEENKKALDDLGME